MILLKALFFILCISISCVQERNENVSTESYSSPLQMTLIKNSILSARVTETKVLIGPSEVIEGLDVPVVSFDLTVGNFVKIMRCASSYRFTTQIGDDIHELGKSINHLAQKEWAWFQALSANEACKLVSEHAITPKVPDLTAANGKYYYVITPCFSKEYALDGVEGCSYDLAFTEVIEFSGSIQESVLKASREIAEAESELQAAFQRAAYLSKLFEIKLRACEDRFAHDLHMNSFKMGLIHLNLFITGFSLGLLIGPNAAVAVTQQVMQVLAPAVAKKADIAISITNSCLKGGESDDIKKDGQDAVREAKMLEENYNVVQVFNEFTKIIGSSDAPGLLEQAKNNLTEKLKKLAEMDARVVSINDTFKKIGIKEGDPDSLEKYIHRRKSHD